MSNPDDRPAAGGTVVDPKLAPRRLKEGLVPPDTGIYLRIEEGLSKGKVFTLSAGGVYVIGREGADNPYQQRIPSQCNIGHRISRGHKLEQCWRG